MMGIKEYFELIITSHRPEIVCTPEQEDMLNALIDVIIKNLAIDAGRGLGKTMCSALVALWFADVYADSIGRPIEIILLSSQPRLYWHIDNFFKWNMTEDQTGYLDNKLVKHGIVDTIPKKGFKLTNGSTVYPVMPTDKGVRSRRADIIIIDEAARVPTAIIKAASPCLEGDICKLILISTLKIGTLFTDIVSGDCEEFADLNFTVKQYSSEDCSWRSESNKRDKALMTPSEYAVEIQARLPTKGERSFFNPKDVDMCIVDVEPIREGGSKSTIEVGIDWGEKMCPTSIHVTERISPTKSKLLDEYCKLGKIEERLPEIAQFILNWRPDVIKADSRPEKFKGLLEPYIKGYKINYVDMAELNPTENNTHKKAMLGQLQKAVRTHHLIIPYNLKSCSSMKLKLEMIRYRFNSGEELKYSKFKANKRKGDDRVDSLALSTYQILELCVKRHSSGLIPC